jgi:NAD(P)-dependent dehydrogenase (short-subunit alcohol dehydrogenase family)
MQIVGKTIVVTGASEGIGKEISLALARRGANVALVARNQTNLEAVLQEVAQLGSPSSKIYVCDVSDPSQIKSTAKQIIADYSDNLVGLVNNAGIWQKKANLEDISDEELQSVLQVDLNGVIHFTKELLPHFKSVGESAIINISSRSGITAQAGQSVYSAAKWGIKGFTQVLKEDLKDTTVHVSGVYQGGTGTDMFNKAGENFTAEKLNSFIKAADLGEVIAYMLALPPQIWLSEIHVENK